jgi:hypothetical protein
MSWQSTGINTTHWTVDNSHLVVRSNLDTNVLARLNYVSTSKQFRSDKTYLFRTEIRRFDSVNTGMSFSVSPGWSNNIIGLQIDDSSSQPVSSTGTGSYFYYYDRPISTSNYTNYCSFRANSNFGTASILTVGAGTSPGIKNLDIFELDWNINGFAYSAVEDVPISGTSHGRGWRYIPSSGSQSSDGYIWVDNNDDSSWRNPAGGNSLTKSANANFREINYITRFIPFNTFNLFLSMQKLSGDNDYGIKIYLSNTSPFESSGTTASFFNYLNSTNTTLLAGLTGATGPAQEFAFFGLSGNKHVVIVGDKATTNNTLSMVVANLTIEGGYHPGNNQLYNLDNSYNPIGLTGAAYSLFVGNGGIINGVTQSDFQINQLTSKIGNGKFKAGIWENGVWNNGWRVDDNEREFYDVDINIRILSNVKWRFRVIGPSQSVSNFKIGDTVSIGNIVAIDINEERKLLKGYYRIVDINETGINNRIGFITVETDTTFPVRRIERDSKNHRIRVTKNIWLSGIFLNGYYSGVWNNGLFKGYPYLTEMYNSNWIDGIFDGGHFHSRYYISGTFSDTIWSNGNVGFTFSQPHNLAVGDLIEVDKDDKTVNTQYDVDALVIEVINDVHIVTNIPWGENTTGKSGVIRTKLANGLVQNMRFLSNNKSKITSNNSMVSDEVFIYDSWMDVNYIDEYATNIGKPQNLLNEISNKVYSENNLYGWITEDVLSSNSRFRDSFSMVERDYKLGTKWKLFNDFTGDSSKFEEYFEPNSLELLEQGWTFSLAGTGSATFSRTIDEGIDGIVGEELRIEAIASGGVLDVDNENINLNIPNRNSIRLERSRYTVAEFNLIDADYTSLVYKFNQTNIIQKVDELYSKKEPLINFNNINSVIRDITIGTFSLSIYIPATYLPINQNVNHLLTPKKKKIEYFFNKRNLGLTIRGGGLDGTDKTELIIDDLRFYEVDMIPFFQYLTEQNVNKSVQVPYQAVAPFIDYTDANFDFLDNVNLGFDSFIISETIDLFSGISIGIGGINVGNVGIGVAFSAFNTEELNISGVPVFQPSKK